MLMTERHSADITRENLAVDLHFARSLVPLNAMTDSHLSELLLQCQPEMVFRGQSLFDIGSFDRQHVYLLHGDMELTDAAGRVTLQKGRSTLMPLAHLQPRAHRAVAKSDCSVLRIDSARLDQLLTWSQVAEYLLLDVSYQRDLDEDVDWIMTVLKSNLFFKVPPINVEQIFSRLTSKVVAAGDVILRQGEIGDGCYFIKEGQAQVTRSVDGISKPQRVADISVGRCFGEDALVNETVRNATVTMNSNGVLMFLGKQDFIRLLKEPRVDMLVYAELASVIERGAIVVDVRTDGEYAEGHLEKAVNIPLNLLRIKTRLLRPETTYVLYCDTGRRSRAAAHLLAKQGFTAFALKDGIQAITPDQRGEVMVRGRDYMLRGGKVTPGS